MDKKEGLRNQKITMMIMHPLVLLLYYIGVIGITMVVREPIFQMEALISAWVMDTYIRRKRKIKDHGIKGRLIFEGMVVIVGAMVNALTYHDGVMILFYVNDNPITGEALLYGATFGFMMVSVITWFLIYQRTMTQEKFLYLFGRISPSFALMVSMIFRYIPLLKSRFKQIHQANVAMGAYRDGNGMRALMNRGGELSVLVSWSFEQSIETAKHMEARGYGYADRSSFHRFIFSKEDKIRFCILFVCIIAIVALLSIGANKVYFYPELAYKSPLYMRIIVNILYLLLMFMPIIFDIRRK